MLTPRGRVPHGCQALSQAAEPGSELGCGITPGRLRMQPKKDGFSLREKDLVFPELTLTEEWSKGVGQTGGQQGRSQQEHIGNRGGPAQDFTGAAECKIFTRCLPFTPGFPFWISIQKKKTVAVNIYLKDVQWRVKKKKS